jgi:hypothetical protein
MIKQELLYVFVYSATVILPHQSGQEHHWTLRAMPRENYFISSLVVLYIDRESVLLLQNWTHLTEILKNMNFMPKKNEAMK